MVFYGKFQKPFDENALIMYGKGSDKGGGSKRARAPSTFGSTKTSVFLTNTIKGCVSYYSETEMSVHDEGSLIRHQK